MGREYSTLHAAALIDQLPDDSRINRIYSDSGIWTVDRTLAAMAINSLRILVWQNTKDGVNGRNKPKPIGPFKDEDSRSITSNPMTIDELDAILSQPRMEVQNG